MKNFKRNTFLLAIQLILFSFLTAQEPAQLKSAGNANLTDSPDLIPIDPSVKIGTLENGIKYYIKKNEKPENRAELRLAVNAGAMQEDEDQLGLAHFTEHMAFNGSKNFTKNELVDYLESVGTRFGPDLNAYTSFDETVYMLQVRSDEADHLDKGLTVIEDWASGISFDGEEIDKERGVVVSEWRSRLSGEQRMQQKYFPVMYHNSRYAERLPIGKPEIIENADYETVKRFYKDWYRPDLMSVIVVGDIDVDMIEKEIKERFGKIQPVVAPRKKENNDVPIHDETLVSVESDKEVAFTSVRMMIKHPHKPVSNIAQYRESLVRSLFNRMLNARLDELTRTAEPPFLFAYSGYGRNVGDLDTYTSSATSQEGNAMIAFEAMMIENYRVLQHGFNVSEMYRQKEEMMKFMEKTLKEKDKTESGRLSMRYVYNYLDDNPIPSPEQQMNLYEQLLPTIEVAEINRLAKGFIKEKGTVIVVTGPEKEDVPLPSKSEILNKLDEIKKMDLEPYEDDVVDEPLMTKKLSPKKIIDTEMMADLGITKWTLGNGVVVMAKQTSFKNDEILMSASSPGGHSLYGMDKYYSADVAAGIINQSGVRIFNLNQLERLLAGKNVNMSPYIAERSEGLRGSCSPDDLETMFQLAYLSFTSPREDDEAFKGYINRQKGIYKNLLSNPNYWFRDQVIKVQTQDHERRGFPKAENLDKVSHKEVMEIYKDRFSDASDFTFYIVGNFEEEQLKEYVQTYLGNLPGKNRVEKAKDVGSRYPGGKVVKNLEKGEAPKSEINILYHGDHVYEDWDNYVLRSLVELTRIKLREAMREDKGGVYGVGVYGGGQKEPIQQYSITISFNADPPKADELIQTAYDEIQKIKDDGVDEKDLQKVKETQKQSQIKNLEENRFWQRSMQNSVEDGTDIKNIQLETLESWIDKLTPADLQKAAQKFFNNDEMIQIVMHPDNAKNG